MTPPIDEAHARGDASHPLVVRLRAAVLDGDAPGAERLADEGLRSGISAQALLDNGLIAAMDEAGRLFESGEFFVPELLVAARAMKAATALLEPTLAAQPRRSAGTVALGTVAGDLHDIGKNLVATMLRGAGFEVIDLGVDVTPAQFADAAARGADVVGLSALLTTTMISMRAVIEALEAAGLRRRVKVMVGGAPVTRQFAESIGADGYADNAGAAVALARQLVQRGAGRPRRGGDDEP
jgi:5-methyltetrahydrofolate--homocysteine methyltransferase